MGFFVSGRMRTIVYVKSTVPVGALPSRFLSNRLLRLRSAADAATEPGGRFVIGPLGDGLMALHVPWLSGLPMVETVAAAAGNAPLEGPGPGWPE